jgi:hypothetical protein
MSFATGNPNKWMVIFDDDRKVPADERKMLAWFSDLTSWLNFLGSIKSGKPAHMYMHRRDTGDRILTKVVAFDVCNPRSTFINPLGISKPEPL